MKSKLVRQFPFSMSLAIDANSDFLSIMGDLKSTLIPFLWNSSRSWSHRIIKLRFCFRVSRCACDRSLKRSDNRVLRCLGNKALLCISTDVTWTSTSGYANDFLPLLKDRSLAPHLSKIEIQIKNSASSIRYRIHIRTMEHLSCMVWENNYYEKLEKI